MIRYVFFLSLVVFLSLSLGSLSSCVHPMIDKGIPSPCVAAEL